MPQTGTHCMPVQVCLTKPERLINKERAAEALLGDDVDPPVTRETMLDEAMHAADWRTTEERPASAVGADR